MKRTIITIALVALAGAALSHGQTLKADIPFDFTVGKTVLSAGAYEIAKLDTPGVLRIHHATDPKQSIMISPLWTQRGREEREGKLVFAKVGTQYFLRAIWTPQEQVGRELLQSAAEKEALVQVHKQGVTLAAVPTRLGR